MRDQTLSFLLGNRLNAVARAVRPGSVVADIGTDHAYLLCYLLLRGEIPRGFACDVGEGPLARAKSTVENAGLAGQVELRLTDGLRGLPMAEINDIVIAGMGGELIAEIIANCPADPDTSKRFILQPMTKAEQLRRALYRMGFGMEREEAVQDGGRVYTVIVAAYTGVSREIDALFAWTGLHIPPRHKDSALYLDKIASALEKKAAGLLQSKGLQEQAGQFACLANTIRGYLKGEDGI